MIPINTRVPLDEHLLDANIDLKAYHINGDVVLQGTDEEDLNKSEYVPPREQDVKASSNRNIQTRFSPSTPRKKYRFVAEEGSKDEHDNPIGGFVFSPEGSNDVFVPERKFHT